MRENSQADVSNDTLVHSLACRRRSMFQDTMFCFFSQTKPVTHLLGETHICKRPVSVSSIRLLNSNRLIPNQNSCKYQYVPLPCYSDMIPRTLRPYLDRLVMTKLLYVQQTA